MVDRVTFTVAETANATGLSESGIREEIRAGRIPAKFVGGRWLIPAAWLKSLADAAPIGAAS